MKRCILFLLLLCLLPLCCAAEETLSFWTNREDVYYHLDPECGDPAGERFALSAGAAELFDRLPCPICVTADAGDPAEAAPAGEDPAEGAEKAPTAEITCAERGGTWVFRVPGAHMEGLEDASGSAPEGTEDLVNLLGESLSDVLDARVAVPADGAPFLSLRVIDGDAYVVTRPKHSYKAKRPFRWVMEHIVLDIFNPGVFNVTGISEVQEYIPPKHIEKPGRVYSETFGALEVDAYSDGSLFIAVLHWDGMTDAASLTGTVRIGDMGEDIPVTGYVSKGQAVYCCVLSEAEYKQLSSGVEPIIIPKLGFEAILDDGAADEGAGDDPFQPVATLPPEIFGEALGA